MATPRAHTTPEVLRWAREAAALTVEDAALRIGVKPGKLQAAEEGEHLLTLRQARLAAEAYGRSLAVLLRRTPPDEPSIEMRFRRLRGAPPPPWSSELVKLEREIRERQDATLEIYAGLGEDPPWYEAAARLDLPDRVPGLATVRALLDLEPPALRAANSRDHWYSRRVVVRAVEWTGVLVVRQRIPDKGVRGFLLPHADVPAIYVNSAEDSCAQAFTIVHEFAHLLLQAAQQSEAREEDWCEQYAGELLMPDHEFEEKFRVFRSASPVSTAKALAREFGVTPLAAAVRSRHLDLFSASDVVAVRDRATGPPKPADGGNGNRIKVARLSPTFTDLVLVAADSSAVTLSTAARLLRTRVDDFDKLRRFTAEALTE